jgi:hypothetical protein
LRKIGDYAKIKLMKAKNFFGRKLILVLLVVQIFACGALFAMAKNQSITGYVKVYGNEPHTYLGLKTEDGTVFTLKADKEVLSEIQNQQGVLLQLNGKVTENKTPLFMGKYQFEVAEWSVVSNAKEDSN